MAVAPGSLSPVSSYTEVWQTTVVFDVGATGAHTLKYPSTTCRGISAITRQAAGQFTCVFTDVGGALLNMDVRYKCAAGTEPPVTQEVVDSFTALAPGGGTALFEVWDIDETQVRIDPPTGCDAVVTVTWLKTL